MNTVLFKKGTVLAVIVLFIGASVIPSTVGINKEEHNSTNNNNSFIAKGMMDTTTVSIDPPSQTVSPGETFTVDVFCVPSQQIKSFEFKLSFDPLLLQANSVTEGDIFDGYTTFFNPGTIDNNAGNIVDIYGLILGSGNVSNPGTLVNISLTAKSTIGSSLLNLYDVGVTNETEYVSITVNDGNVTIQGANNNPNMPSDPTGPTAREIGQSGSFNTSATDPDGDQVQYRFDWDADGGNDYSNWTTLGASGHTDNLSHSWDDVGTYMVKAQARDEHGYESIWSDPLTVVVSSGENQPPNKPSTPSGPTSGKTGTQYEYSSNTIDPDGDQVQYRFDWDADGGNDYSNWTTLGASGHTDNLSHSWDDVGTYMVKAQARDEHGYESIWSDPLTVVVSSGENQPPNKPSTPSGPTSGKTGTQYEYSSNTIDPDGDDVVYMFDWGDGTNSGWLGPYTSGDTVNAFKTWTAQGSYSVKVKAMDSNLEERAWSDPLPITMPKNKAINLFLLFLERLIERFPILEQLLQPVYDKLEGFQ